MFKFAIGNLFSRPLRSTLSMMGLAVAIAGMVGLFSIAGGIDSVVRSTFEQIPGLLVQQRGAPVPLFSNLPAAWGDEIAQLKGVNVVDPEIVSRANIIDGKTIISPPRFVAGTSIDASIKMKHSVYRNSLVAGRFLEDEDRGKSHCVISKSIADEFEKSPGDRIVVNRFEFEVIGIYETGSLMLDVNIVMDLDVVRSLTRFAPDTVNCFYVEPDGTISNEELKAEIEKLFEKREIDMWRPTGLMSMAANSSSSLNSNPLTQFIESLDGTIKNVETSKESPQLKAVDDPEAEPLSSAEVRTADEWSERFDEFSGDLDIFLTMITTIGVLIAMLSIVNTMLMSITERTTEFGILRANGWSRRHIMSLITLESSLLGATGGVIGIVLGWIGTLIVNANFPERIQLHAGIDLLFFGLGFSVAIGVIGGLYPAWRAANMSPMESIRRG